MSLTLPLFLFLFLSFLLIKQMTRLAIDTSSIGSSTQLRLATVHAPADTADTVPSAHELLSLIDYQHVPPHLVSERTQQLHVDTRCSKQDVRDTVSFVETLFKSSLATRRLVSLLLTTDTPGVFGVVFPDLSPAGPYALRLAHIDFTDEYVSSLLHPQTPLRQPQTSVVEPQSTLARSLNAHIIRRKSKSATALPISTTATTTPASTTPSTPASLVPSSPPSSTSAASRDTLRSDNFIPLLERLIRGEFRMRRLDSRLDQNTLRRLEKLLIRAVLFRFRGRPGLQPSVSDQRHTPVGVSVAEIEGILDTLIPLLL